MTKLLQLLKKPKVSVALVLIIAAGGYLFYKKAHTQSSVKPQYVTAIVEKGTLTVSVSGAGQVSSSSQLDIKPEASGKLILVNAVQGQEVKQGQLLASIDAKDALKAVRDAEVNLQSAQLAMEKLQQPATALTLTQAENSLQQSQESKEDAQNSLTSSYADGYTAVVNSYLDMPEVMTGLQNIFYKDSIEKNQQNVDWYEARGANYKDTKVTAFKQDFISAFAVAKAAYEKNSLNFKNSSRQDSPEEIKVLMSETYDTAQAAADAVKAGKTLVDYTKDLLDKNRQNIPSVVISDQSSLGSYTSALNSRLGDLASNLSGIKNALQSLAAAERSITEKTQNLNELKAGADPLDVKSHNLTLKQRQNALTDAWEALAKYSVRAPFDGVVAKIDAKKGDSASSGASLLTLITKQQIASIALNEVDVPKVKVGQKAVLTFDAIEDLSITGKVALVDSLGTATQGVVNYTANISFDTQDERVKPGMSVTVNIITEAKPDVLLVPSSAVKGSGSSAYVEVMANGEVRQVPVTVGASNDTSTEILSGLSEGQSVVSQTISATSGTTSTQLNRGGSILPVGGGGAVFRASGGFR